MKFRSFIWISAAALIILALVQYYFITETFQTKQQQFDSKYSGLAKLGMYEFENKYFDAEEDSILYYLDDVSYFAIHDVGIAASDERRDSLAAQIYNEFDYQLNELLSKDYFLRQYFTSTGDDSVFVTTCYINALSLLSYGDEFVVPMDSSRVREELTKQGYLINSYTIERNYFRIQYDYYIAFPHRKEQISREMVLTITLSFVTLLIVFGVFFMTLRNLLIQKRLSELKTDFINNMTHELKTPLSTISVASSSLAMNEGHLSRPRIVEISDIIKKQNKHLSRLIDRILDITIWEKGQIRIDRNPVEIFQFIGDVAEDFKTAHPKSKLMVEMDKVSDHNVFSIDDVHMTTVINNLLSNALKYGGDPAETTLRVSCNSSLDIEVTDKGQGIPKEEQKQIFDKFFRGKETKKNAVRGLGLGLYYVKQIVEAHQGTIRLESSDEQGSTFVIEIPE